MLTFYHTNMLMKLKKIYKISVKKLVFFQRMQKIPKLNFFLLKKPMQITNKTRQALYADRSHQKIPLCKKRIPYGNLLKAENPLKFIRKTVRQKADYTHKQNHHLQFSIQEGNTKKTVNHTKPKPSQKCQIKKCKNPHKNPSKPRQGLEKHHRPKTVPKDENWDGLNETKFREFEEKKRGIYQHLTVIIECPVSTVILFIMNSKIYYSLDNLCFLLIGFSGFFYFCSVFHVIVTHGKYILEVIKSSPRGAECV